MTQNDDDSWLTDIDPDDVRRHAQLRDNPAFRAALARFDAHTIELREQFERERAVARRAHFDDLLRDLSAD